MDSPAKQREILFVAKTLGGGGAERVVCELASEWARLGCAVTIIQTVSDTTSLRYPLHSSVSVVPFPKPSRVRAARVIADCARLFKVMREHPSATVVAFLTGPIIKCALLSFFVGNRMVFSERCDPRRIPNTEFARRLVRWAFGRADACVFQTEFARSLYPESIQRKGTVIPNPVTSGLPEPFKGQRRKTIVSACRLSVQKNISMSIEAFALLHKDYPDYTFEIFGNGELRDKLRDKIDSLGLTDCVFLRQYSGDLHSCINDAAIFLSTSDFEGISNSMLEALALGIPSVVTDCPVFGARTVIEDGVSGLLVPVGDTVACYRAMRRIIEDPGLAESLSSNASAIAEKLNVEIIARRWLDVL